MPGTFRIEAFAIVSSNGMIADSECLMPNSLKFETDQEFLETSLDNAAVLVHGRKSHEMQANSHNRRRLLMTRGVRDFAPDPETRNVWFWNPAGLSLDDACRELGVNSGIVAVIGGTAAYDMFLSRYAAFHLCKAGKVHIPDGTPVLSEVSSGRATHEVLRDAGLSHAMTRVLDIEHDLVHEYWKR